jgi:hypothetical protein
MESVADGLEDVAVCALDCRAQESIVVSEVAVHRRGLLFPEAGTAFDIREEERHGTRHHGRSLSHR